MTTRQIPQVHQFILEFLEFQKFALVTDYYSVLFLTDSVFRVLFAYFDESMASKIVYKP